MLFQSALSRSPRSWTRRLRYAGTMAFALTAASGATQASADDTLDAGRQLFLKTTPACAACHTLADAGATGAIGPVLDELKPDAARVEQAIRNGIGVMPAYTALSDDEIKTLSTYVAKASSGT